MITRTIAALTILGLAWWNLAGARPDEKAGDSKGPSAETVAKAQKALLAYLEKRQVNSGQVHHIESAALAHDFPEGVFFALRFRLYPVARVPKGLKGSNIFVVCKAGKVQQLRDDKELEKYFKDKSAAVRSQKGAENALAGWLTLAQEFFQDGFFKFEILDKAFSIAAMDGNWTAAGRALVMQGGNGEINVTMKFKEGKLAKVTQISKTRPGPRPICQATKLLDPDPLVRRMAEQDLLIMGVAATEYLQQQRAQARPELRQAIDRLRQRIVKNGW